MSPDLTTTLKTVIKMRKEFPYYGPVIERLRINENTEISTVCVTPNLEVRFNPVFLQLVVKNGVIKGLMLHEMLHYLFKHAHREKHSIRRGQVTHQLHNIAQDLEINQYIPRDILPNDGCFVEDFRTLSGEQFPRGLSYEQYLELLIKNYEDDADGDGNGGDVLIRGNGQGNGNGNGDSQDQNQNKGNKNQKKKQSLKDFMKEHNIKAVIDTQEPQDNDGDGDSKDSLEATENRAIDSLIAECEAAERKSGQTAGNQSGLGEQLLKINKRPYKWRDIFKTLVLNKVSAIKAGYEAVSYQRVNKRMMAQGGCILFPGHIAYDHTMKLVIGMDVSESMGSLTQKMYEVMKSVFDYTDFEIDLTVLECDVGITKVIENFNSTTDNLDSSTGGGTDMGAIATYIQDHKMNPDLIIVMTDNFTGWDPVIYPEKTVVMTDNVSDSCPYKQYYVFFEDEKSN